MKKIFSRLSFIFSWFAFFFFGFCLFFLPSQSQLVAQAKFEPELTQEIDFDLPLLAAYPIKKQETSELELTATAAAVLDRDSGIFLFTKNPNKRLLPASIVKIMTALVSLDHYSLLQVLRVPAVSNEGQDMELVEGELITVEALLHGLLISSANDAAQVLARNYPEGKKGFIQKMNEKAKNLSLKNTHFTNPTGLDNSDAVVKGRHESFSTSREIAWLADQALKNETFAGIVSTRQVVLMDPHSRFVHSLYNLNQLLWRVSGVKGVKTGWTEKAGECLVTYLEREGKRLIFVILGSQDRFGESERLIEWVMDNYNWEILKPS